MINFKADALFIKILTNISYYNTLKMKKELLVLVLLPFFITLINLGTQIQGAQTRYNVNYGLNQPLHYVIH